jgi:RNA polymerase sigma-70 factor (ECF subfamily)
MAAHSLESIWETFHTPLAQFVRARVADASTAEDLLQDVYVKIHTHLDTLRDDERLPSWIYQIARNTIHDYYRRQKPLDLLDDVDETLAESPSAPEFEALGRTPERLAASVHAIIDALPDHYRQAVILAELDGLTQREVADRLGLSLSGAKSRVQRGRALLREMMLACCSFQLDRYGNVIDYTPRGATCHYEDIASR